MAVRNLGKINTWQIDYYPAGRKGERVRLTFKGTYEEAIQLEVELVRRHAQDIPNNPFIKQALPDWLAWCRNNLAENTVIDIEKCLKKIIPFFGAIRFRDLMPLNIEAYKTKRQNDGVKDRTINKELSYFSSLVSWAPENNYCTPMPFKIKLIPKTDSPDPDLLNMEDVQKIIDNIEPRYLCILLLYYDMALRRRETLDLTVERVNLATNSIRVLGKNGKDETVSISTDRLRLALEIAVAEAGSGYLFKNPKSGKPYYSIRKALKRAAVKAGITKRVYAHLFRHCFGTHGLESGIHARVMQRLLRHSTIKTTERYTQISARFKESETRKFASIVERERGPMEKVIGGKRYDTAKAELVAERTNALAISDSDYIREEIYRTAKGNWFLIGEGGSRTKYCKDGHGIGRDIYPLTEHEAMAWLERHATIDVVEKYFAGEIEDA